MGAFPFIGFINFIKISIVVEYSIEWCDEIVLSHIGFEAVQALHCKIFVWFLYVIITMSFYRMHLDFTHLVLRECIVTLYFQVETKWT